MGWFMREVLGVGYDYVERVLMGDLALKSQASRWNGWDRPTPKLCRSSAAPTSGSY
jgi:hypothetical protein